MVLDVVRNTSHFLVENVRTSRRFISSLKLGVEIPELQFEVLDKKTSHQQLDKFFAPAMQGKNIGVMSEAGLPGLADPGALAVAYAHQHGIQVVPLPGPSSIQTVVISSGFSGQRFTFHGYLPIQKKERIQAIKELESNLKKTGYTQVFMETPFRNMQLMKDLTTQLSQNVQLCVGVDLFGKQEYVKTQPVSRWKNSKKDFHKVPAVYCIGQFS
ncbi:16S rRNA (cytidine1402-2'-O)-methyltransferase [Marinoscillum furvescens DSM 4134]|uniref:16S rRNA (Cytidine1402-2'-O)-methyltransferase n=2 Tax=Marinoscillum furvescens TaxID=1026 RepID=A0A3D9L9D6_MARFU|nr:16S rRNA (cytidine1402-2'-O)-methyltransferase [Marinoscillum furvescens DSM 4134]